MSRFAIPSIPQRPGPEYAWGAPGKAVNPYLNEPAAPPETELSRLIALYAAENRQQQQALAEEAQAYYFFSDERDPVLRELAQDRIIGLARLARERQKANPDLTILADLKTAPLFIRRPLLQKVESLRNPDKPQAFSHFLQQNVKPALDRLDRVRDSQLSVSFRSMAGLVGLDRLLNLPELSQSEVKRLAARVAAYMNDALDSACTAPDCHDMTPETIHQVWETVAKKALRLDVIPPAWERLKTRRRRRKPVPYELIPGSLARLLCADWWARKLWRMRCEWREEQLRAVCLVSKNVSPYVSFDAVLHKREQRRRSLAFFQAHELVSEDGDVLAMDAVVRASNSSPVHRRHEMMACVKGMELIAEVRGDCAVFYTLTCPSRFHATLKNGQPNPKWNASTVRQSSDYLVGVFAAFRKAMNKKGLRWYGVRVSEPHHDGTVHWHLLCFMRKEDRVAITQILRDLAVREDREELGRNITPRFKAKLVDPRQGSATGYIAKYVSKNVDGRGLAKETGRETGRSLRDTVENVTAWASLHRVKQFQFFGIPGRQAYRELRRLARQSVRTQPGKKVTAPVLADHRLDAVLAAADVGCFATYIMKQGGVLVPRKNHLIRTAYEQAEEPGKYGDRSMRIYGIWSPLTGERIGTHTVKWKKVKKTAASQEAPADQGACAPWTRGNNCPLDEKTAKEQATLDQIIAEIKLSTDEEIPRAAAWFLMRGGKMGFSGRWYRGSKYGDVYAASPPAGYCDPEEKQRLRSRIKRLAEQPIIKRWQNAKVNKQRMPDSDDVS